MNSVLVRIIQNFKKLFNVIHHLGSVFGCGGLMLVLVHKIENREASV